jgi:2-dehydropantoate 2-reductase
MVPMKILVYGAGVIGTLYAARLQEAGHRVTILARNSRLADVRRHGLVLEDVVTGVRSVTHVSVADRLYAEDSYDLALIAVRKDQLSAVMPDLASNRGIPTVLFMLNNPLGSAKLVDALGLDRVLLGFPGAGGELQGHLVRYAMIAQQPTTLGEPGGRQTVRLLALVKALRASGFRTRVGLATTAGVINSIIGDNRAMQFGDVISSREYRHRSRKRKAAPPGTPHRGKRLGDTENLRRRHLSSVEDSLC